MEHSPRNPEFRQRLEASVAQPGFTRLLGTTIRSIEPGTVELEIDYRDELAQHHGYFHGGVIGALADNACGMAAGTLVDAASYPITSEYKINILRPAVGQRLVARAVVVKAGATITVCRADVYSAIDDTEQLTATMLASLVNVSAG
jgi:uncharacterized protein (TIGR00369 family)